MAKAGKKEAKPGEIVVICRNRRATFDYEISDVLECGIVLVGTEVKSLRDGHATLEDAYGQILSDELWLNGLEIPVYWAGNRLNHEPKRSRKLLLHKRELAKFAEKASDRGFTLVPLRLYFKDGRAKVELAVGRGKQVHDKRESLKKAEATREIDRALNRKRR